MRMPWWSQEPQQNCDSLLVLPPSFLLLCSFLSAKPGGCCILQRCLWKQVPCQNPLMPRCAFLTLINSTFWKGSDGLPLATTFLLCKWKALNPDAQPRKTVFQKRHLASWQALPGSCLGSVALSLDLSRVSDTMASLAGKSRQLPISFGSPLILRNEFILFHPHWIYFSPLCPQEFQNSPNTNCFLPVPVFCMTVSLETGWDPPPSYLIPRKNGLALPYFLAASYQWSSL